MEFPTDDLCLSDCRATDRVNQRINGEINADDDVAAAKS